MPSSPHGLWVGGQFWAMCCPQEEDGIFSKFLWEKRAHFNPSLVQVSATSMRLKLLGCLNLTSTC